MLLSNSVITPTKNVVTFSDDDFLIEAVYEDDELRPLVPHVDEMLGDITATWKGKKEANKLGDEVPEWDDPDYSESRNYAKVVRDILIDAGCIFAELDRYEKVIYFTGHADVLKRSFDFCVETADESEAVLRVVSPSSSASSSAAGSSS
jgi:hypothetical protein